MFLFDDDNKLLDHSMEIFYNKTTYRWEYTASFGRYCVSGSEAENLKNARKNNKYLITKNRYMLGIDAKYIYYPIDYVKLIFHKGKTDLVYIAAPGQRAIRSSRDIINYKKIKPHIKEDYKYIIEYVEDISYMNPEEQKLYGKKKMKESYDTLSDDAKLYYQLFGNMDIDNN